MTDKLATRPKVYRVGSDAEIVTDELEQSYVRFMQSIDNLREAVLEFSNEMRDIDAEQRQRVKNDIRNKRKQIMKNRGKP